MSRIAPQLDIFTDADSGAPYGMSVAILSGLFLLYPQAEWPESVELINRCGRCTEPLKALEHGTCGYLACACLALGYDTRLYARQDLITRWRTWRRLQNQLLSALQEQ